MTGKVDRSGEELFIAQARQKGLSDDKISQLLIDKGWEVAEVDMALNVSLNAESSPAPLTMVDVIRPQNATNTAPDLAQAVVPTLAKPITEFATGNGIRKPPSLLWYCLYIFGALALLILLIFVVNTLLQIGPRRSDNQKRQALVNTVKAVKEYAGATSALPTSLDDVPGADKGIHYSHGARANQYQLCANFKQNNTGQKFTAGEVTDGVVYEFYFQDTEVGENCWMITATKVPASGFNVVNGINIPTTPSHIKKSN